MKILALNGGSSTLKATLRELQATPPAALPTSYSADGLYNLGNSYARAGQLGLAALAYERAGLLAPNDPDIHANLVFVRAAAHVPMAPRHWYTSLVPVPSPALAAWLGVAGLLLIGVGLVIGRITRRSRWLACTAPTRCRPTSG